jgi:ATP citrate (pro-S)-lyase
MQFVNEMRRRGDLIMGIGHRVKSLNNPDKRVEILKAFALDRTKFAQPTPFLEYALEVEKITTTKVGVRVRARLMRVPHRCRNQILF